MTSFIPDIDIMYWYHWYVNQRPGVSSLNRALTEPFGPLSYRIKHTPSHNKSYLIIKLNMNMKHITSGFDIKTNIQNNTSFNCLFFTWLMWFLLLNVTAQCIITVSGLRDITGSGVLLCEARAMSYFVVVHDFKKNCSRKSVDLKIDRTPNACLFMSWEPL